MISSIVSASGAADRLPVEIPGGRGFSVGKLNRRRISFNENSPARAQSTVRSKARTDLCHHRAR